MAFRSNIGKQISDAFKQMSNGSLRMFRCGKYRFGRDLEVMMKKERKNPLDWSKMIEIAVAKQEFKHDVLTSFPALLVFSLPLIGFWLALPLVLFYPDMCLSRQFWTAKQRMNNYNKSLDRRKKRNYPEVKENLQELLDLTFDPGLKRLGHKILSKPDISVQEFDALALALNKPELQRHLFGTEAKFRVPLALCYGVNILSLPRKLEDLVTIDRAVLKGSPPKKTIEHLPRDVLDIIAHHRGITISEDKSKVIEDYITWLKYTQRYTSFKLGSLKSIMESKQNHGILLYAPILLFSANRCYTFQ